MDDARIIVGDCRAGLATLEAGSAHTCITSPPYWGLRDYGHDGQMGLEQTPDAYVAGMVEVFRAVARVLRPDGTLWLNLGDSYTGSAKSGAPGKETAFMGRPDLPSKGGSGLKPKDLCGIPWRVAFALQADGWYLRSDIIWAKPNPMPESVTDRPTKAHEYLFLLAHPDSGGRYYYDADAIADTAITAGGRAGYAGNPNRALSMGREPTGNERPGASVVNGDTRNKRSVWHIPTQPFPGAHFAVMPPALVIPCVKAGTSERGCCGECGAPFVRVVERAPMEIRRRSRGAAMGPKGKTQASGTMVSPARSTTTGWARSCDHDGDPVPCTVLDPFAGAGTVGVVATGHGRRFVGCELSGEYAALAEARIANPGANLRAPVADPRQGVLFG